MITGQKLNQSLDTPPSKEKFSDVKESHVNKTDVFCVSDENDSSLVQDRKNLSAKIKEYRKTTHDFITPDEIVQKRMEYLEALCRNIIRDELKK